MTADEFTGVLVELGWKQADLCRRVAVTKSTASRWGQEGPPRWVGEYLRVMLELDRLHRLFVRPPKGGKLELVAEDGVMKFPARLELAEEGGYVVTFRDVPEAVTQGETEEESLEMAADVLVSAMTFYTEAGKPLPLPSKARKGERLVDFRMASCRAAKG